MCGDTAKRLLIPIRSTERAKGNTMSRITVYTAKQIRTMNPSLPTATAVAVRDGRIIEVGSVETMRPWLDAHPHIIDDTFAKHTLMPGFIDPHLHPSLAAILLPTHFITAMEWKLPDRVSAPVHGHNAYLDRLKQIEEGMPNPTEPLLSWGYHGIWHGKMSRSVLNGISKTRPIIIWQRSFHELYANDAAIEWMGLDRKTMEGHPQIDAEEGRFYETGIAPAMNGMKKLLLSPERFKHGLKLTKQAIHLGGHTTICDMGMPMLDMDLEWSSMKEIMDTDDTPFRVQFVARAVERGGGLGREKENLERVRGMKKYNTHRLQFRNGVKLFTDGGYYAELMQVQAPGFIDGHEGEWLMPPEVFETLARIYWNEGFRIHVHCTGDLGVELALDVLEKLQFERPRFNHRFTIEHFGLSTPEQVRRMADLGALASVNAYYVHELGDAYWKKSIGLERSSQMSRLGTLFRHNVPTALHTDFTMAPAHPLTSAWVAVNRLSESGVVMAPEERLTVEQALRAITIDAAYVIGMEHEIGTIRAGKKADFVVLGEDPMDVAPSELKNIPIWGTVFEGQPAPISKTST